MPTGELNRWFEAAIEANPPPAPKGKRIKLRYITQVKTPAADLRRVRQPHRRAARKLSPLSGQRAAARPEARAVPLRLEIPRPQQSLRSRPLSRAKSKFTLLSASPVHCGTMPEVIGHWGAYERPTRAGTSSTGRYFEKNRAELGPGFIRILSYFREDGAKSVAADRACDARAEHDCAGAARAHHQGRGAPAWRRAAREDGRADRNDRALVHRNPPLPRRTGARKSSSFAGCSTKRRAVRQGDQPAGDARAAAEAASAARRRTRASAGSESSVASLWSCT